MGTRTYLASAILSLACLVATVLVVVDLGTQAQRLESVDMADADVELLESGIQSLQRRVDDLLASNQSLRIRLEGLSATDVTPVPDNYAELSERVDELIQKVVALERIAQPRRVPDEASDGAGGLPAPGLLVEEALRTKSVETALRDYQAQMLDPEVSEIGKLETIKMLRMFPEELQALDGAVLGAALDLARSSEDPKVRSGVIRQLKDVQSDDMLVLLVDSLRDDGDLSVREEAAECLVGYRDDPRVQAALEHAASQDASESVRQEARRAMAH